jgi:hypothetical protein
VTGAALGSHRCADAASVGAELEGHAVHRSRLSTLLIDTPEADAAVAFWSGALGVPTKPVMGEEQFTGLEGALPGLVTAVQRIDGEPRIHVDMETDDLDAETARLVALGATEISRWLECRTLRVPGGHIVCVIPVHSDRAEFAAAATVWE